MDIYDRKKLLLFDLDDTLLRSGKTISERTLEALRRCREQGVLIGISTSRAVHDRMAFLPELTRSSNKNSPNSVKVLADPTLAISPLVEIVTKI